VVSFSLTSSTLKSVIQAASILELPNIVIHNDDNNLCISAMNPLDRSSNKFTKIINNDCTAEVNHKFDVANFKILLHDYTVSVSSKGITRFTTEYESKHLCYWIASEYIKK